MAKVKEMAKQIINYHWPRIANDLGECDISDLVDHWLMFIDERYTPESAKAIIACRDQIIIEVRELNYGNDTVTP